MLRRTPRRSENARELALRNDDEFVAHGRGRGVVDRAGDGPVGTCYFMTMAKVLREGHLDQLFLNFFPLGRITIGFVVVAGLRRCTYIL